MKEINHDYQVRVRYAETDQMGVVYHGNYATYFEVARVEFLRSLGINYSDLEKKGIILPVLELNMKYIRPAFYDDLLTINTICKEINNTRITFESTISKEGKPLTIGLVTLVFVDGKTRKPMRCPDEFAELFGVTNSN